MSVPFPDQCWGKHPRASSSKAHRQTFGEQHAIANLAGLADEQVCGQRATDKQQTLRAEGSNVFYLTQRERKEGVCPQPQLIQVSLGIEQL